MSSVETVHRKLTNEWAKSNQAQVKKCLEELQELIYDPANQLKDLSPHAAFTILKDYYEINAFHFVIGGDFKRFEQAIKETIAFYDTQRNSSGQQFVSEQQYLIYGLYLMHLLATNKIEVFHMFIERIDYDKRKTDPFLHVPIKLERFLMEGAYNSMNLTESSLPSPYYKPFMATLKQSVQNEIAVSLEKSYRSIPLKLAMKQLFLKDEKEVLAFGAKRGWIRKGDEFLITGVDLNEADSGKQQTSTLALASGVERVLQPLDTESIISRILNYASQLERIV